MIEVDGSRGEGGGQIFRLALALSALQGEEVRITNIRAGRPNPGLARQHITSAEALASICGGKAKGLRLGSSDVTFRPSRLRGGSHQLDVGTAGSVTLVLQACLLPAISAESPTELKIRGGTDVKWSPPSDYFVHVILPHLRRMGIGAEVNIARRGYYPKGGGLIEARVRPSPSVKPLYLPALGEVLRIRGQVHVSNLPEHIAQRMKRSAQKVLIDYPDVSVEQRRYDEAMGPGGGIVLWAESENTSLGASALAERGVRAEDLGRGAAEELGADIKAGATLDVHAADQLLPYMALAKEPSTFLVRKVSGHTRTMFWLLSKFLDVDFQEEEAKELTRIEVRPSHTWRA